jgi:hypothetical protein
LAKPNRTALLLDLLVWRGDSLSSLSSCTLRGLARDVIIATIQRLLGSGNTLTYFFVRAQLTNCDRITVKRLEVTALEIFLVYKALQGL